MASNIFNPVFPCELMKRLTKLRSLKFISETAKLDAVKANTKTSAKSTKTETYRSKDVLKLIQIDKKYKLVEPGSKVLDIGAAPGSCSQFLAQKTNANGKVSGAAKGLVVAIDKKDFGTIEGVHSLPNMDFLKETSRNKIAEILGRGKKFDFIFSDLIPSTSGVPSLDESRMVKSILIIYLFMVKYLRQGGSCLINIKGAEDSDDVKGEAQKLFREVHYPAANTSVKILPDIYLVGRNFIGVKM